LIHIKYFISLLIISCFSTACISEVNHNSSLGAGAGVIYGGLGVKLDYEFLSNTYITAGLGEDPSIGMQFYLRDNGVFWRPKISVHYGLVGYATGSKLRSQGESGRKGSKIIQRFYGGIIEFGQSLQFGRARHHALDLALTFGLTDGGEEEWKDRHSDEYDYADGEDISVDLGEVISTTINVGYRYNF
jgi:hypothetical protein